MDALLDQIPEDSGSGVVITVKSDNVPPNSPALAQKPRNNVLYDPSLVYILELSTILALRDDHTVQLLGKRVVDALQAILRDISSYHPITVSRTTFYSFRLLQASYVSSSKYDRSGEEEAQPDVQEYDFIRAPVLLHTVSSFSPDNLKKTSKLVLQGLKLCVDEQGPLRNETMTSPDFWAILRNLATEKTAAPTVFEILEIGVSPSSTAIMADNYEAAIGLLNDFASAASATVPKEPKADPRRPSRKPARPSSAKPEAARYVWLAEIGLWVLTLVSESPAVQRGINAVNIIYSMTSRIPQLMKQSHLENNEGELSRLLCKIALTDAVLAWSAYWLPIFEALTTQCTNPRREIRQLAFNSLQRALFSPELTSSDHREWTAIFGEVLFPLILRLLKPEVFSSDRDGMSETRVQAASLLCKVFLQYLVLLSEWEGMLDLWLKIIDIMDRLMNSGQGDSLVSNTSRNPDNICHILTSKSHRRKLFLRT